MTDADSRAAYRAIIDELVQECLEGQGKVLPSWVRRGNWPQEPEINALLERLPPEGRALIARMLGDAYSGAVHDVLRVLDDNKVPPFHDSYEHAVPRLRRPSVRRLGLARRNVNPLAAIRARRRGSATPVSSTPAPAS